MHITTAIIAFNIQWFYCKFATFELVYSHTNKTVKTKKTIKAHIFYCIFYFSMTKDFSLLLILKFSPLLLFSLTFYIR